MKQKPQFTGKLVFGIYLIFLITVGSNAKSQESNKGASELNPQQSLYTGSKAIIVGVSDYMNIQSLNYAHTDALNFYNFLISDAGGNVNPDNIVLLLNEEATSANIYAALDWLVDAVKEGERIIIYFSGHGDLESKTIRQNGFLLGHDSPKNCYMAGGTVSVRFLQDYLETIAIKSKSDIIMITDACRSGKLAGGHEGASNTTAALAQNWENITKVLSSQAGEYSFEGDKWGDGAGVFTYYLVNGMTGLADRNNNKEVTAQELYIYMLDNIGRETNFSQNPTLVGNMTSTLAWVDSLSLAMIEENIEGETNELLAMKGIESMYEKQLDEETLAQYKKFRDCIENGRLTPEYSEGDNAWDINNSLKENENAKSIHNHMHRSLLAALQNESQVIINLFLATEEKDKIFDYDEAGNELDYASELCDTNYILFDDIRARSLFFSSLENFYTTEDKIDLLETAIEIQPDAAYLHNQLGSRYNEIENYINAIQSYKKAIELSQSWPYPYSNIGLAYHNIKQYDKAVKSYLKAIELKPDYSNAYYNLGNTYINQKQYNKAVESYLKAIEIKPDLAIAYNNLGIAYNNLEQYDKAIETYLKVIELKPDDADAYYNLGSTYYFLEQYEKAIESFLISIELEPNDPATFYNLGVTYSTLEQYDRSIDSYLKAIELDSGYALYHYILGLSYIQMEQYNKGVECFIKAIELDEKNVDYYTWLGVCYLKTENYAQALESFEKSIELNPDDPSNYYNVACLYSLQNNVEESLIWFEKSLEKGYDDWDNIAEDSDLGNIRDNKKFNLLIKEYKK